MAPAGSPLDEARDLVLAGGCTTRPPSSGVLAAARPGTPGWAHAAPGRRALAGALTRPRLSICSRAARTPCPAQPSTPAVDHAPSGILPKAAGHGPIKPSSMMQTLGIKEIRRTGVRPRPAEPLSARSPQVHDQRRFLAV